LAANAEAGPPVATNHGNLAPNQFTGESWQLIKLALSPAVLDGHVLAVDIAGVFEALAKGAHVASLRYANAG
jgi:hypothetical protein